MFTTVSDFLTTWRHESAVTAHLMAELRDGALAQPIAPGYRTLGDVAWHIVVSPKTILRHAGLALPGPDKTVSPPDRAGEIHSNYVDAAQALARAVQTSWDDRALREMVDFYGQPVSRGQVLAIVLRHEIHHRGQMTVLMRQAGLTVHGVYGPARDEPR